MCDVYCKKCDLLFEAELWHNGRCPQCCDAFYWDCIETTDHEGHYDEIAIVGWYRDEE